MPGPNSVLPGEFRFPRANGSHELEVRKDLTGLRVNACVVQHGRVVDLVFLIAALGQLMEFDLTQSLQAHSKGPHNYRDIRLYLRDMYEQATPSP